MKHIQLKASWRKFVFLCFLISGFISYAQENITVSGVVRDDNGLLPGVTVIVKGSSQGTTTNFDGEYTLENVSPNATLEFSFIGFQTQEISVNGRSEIDLVMQTDSQALDEVVVIGYGTQNREAVTGSVVSVKGEELNEVKTANFQEALIGRAAGVNISTNNTRPGASPQVRIRGVRSLSGNNDPLIVLNGIPFSGGLSDINPNDIESLDILKDASATAIYGSRGANGVILITTKTGREGQKATFSYNTYYAVKEVFNKYPLMNAAQLTQLRADVAAHPNQNGTPIYDLGGDEDLANDTDWQDLLYGTGLQTSHDISVQGGSEKGTYNMGLGYFKETSVVPDDSFERFSLRAQIDQEVGSLFRFGLNSVLNYNQASSIVGVGGVLSASPLLSPYDENGDFLGSVRLQTQADNLWIPTRNEINRIGDGRKNQQLDFGAYNNLYGEVKIPWVEGLKYRMNIGLNFRTSRDGNFTGQGVFNYNATNPSSGSYNTSITRDYVIENQILYDRTFAEKHKVNFVGLFSAQNTQYDNSGLSVRNIPDENSLWYNLDSALTEDITGYGTGYSATGLLSYMGRILYQYDNRYLMTATLRADGSSRLAPGNKWVTYPAVSVGWNIGNEAFMEDVEWINLLKLRAGYGETSNQAIAPYSVQGRLNTVNYNFGSTFATGYFVNQLPNPNLGWEFSETYNYGLDFGLFDNRLTGTFEYYLTKTNDILYTLGLPATSGVGNVTSNIGATQNKGFEISLNATIIDNPDGFTWDAGINIYRNQNEITSLASGQLRDEGNLWFVGSPINVIYDYDNIGLWNESDPDFQYLSQYEPGASGAGMIRVRYTGEYNADGSPVRAIGPEDRVIIDPTPNFRGGFNSRLAYKNFDLNVVGTFQNGGTLVSTLYSSSGYLNLLTGRTNNVDVDYWTPTNTDARYPAPGGLQSGDNPKYASTLGYFDASYLKIRSLTLGYNFDQDFTQGIGLQRLRVYASAQNPFVLFSPFYDESGLDPEITNSGVDGNGNRQNVAVNTTNVSRGIPTIGTNVPSTRNYLIGLNISF
ncbi:SusC/RagA family TonB-linked outer membrane protein [Christiangramia flava]|uniref:TonB-dependent receptor n=1 Tax=Christiangramia flava JLT2011 TaxID=1229726 RepID=A0A1L7I0C5_9FLAO|nr:TonB-dependent receptor [Christiangramia flava]APU67046.1 TonB-dependent receptor [Christiangramia flava JLT2011]OSS38719.1 TonB-dependent receptor [Christiangramia flava JLT2011]